MSWMIVSDSSCELRSLENPAPGLSFATVPLKIRVGEREFVDNSALDVDAMIDAMHNYNGAATTACPSPEEWAEKYLQADQVIALTITSSLSGCYNAAVQAKEHYEAEHPGRRVCCLDSLSAGPELVVIAEKLRELIKTCFSKKLTYSCNSRVVFKLEILLPLLLLFRIEILYHLFRSDNHCPEL